MDLNAVQSLGMELIIAAMGIFLGIKCFALKKNHMNYFMRFVIALNLALLTNIPVRISETRIAALNWWVTYVLYAVSAILITWICYYWFVFLLKQLDSKLVEGKKGQHLLMIPAILSIPACIANYWTGWFFYIDENCWYHRGSIFFLQSVLSYSYFLAIIVGSFINLFKGKQKPIARKFCISLIPALCGIYLQLQFGGSYLLAGCITCAFILYVEICLNRQKAYELNEALSDINSQLLESNQETANNVRTIIALADMYHIMYDVDLAKDTFTKIKAPAQVTKFCSQFTSARDCLMNLPKAMFYKEDVQKMEAIYNPDTLNQRLKFASSCYADAKGLYTDNWLRTNIIVSERDDDGNVTRIIVSLQNVNKEIEQQRELEQAMLYKKHASEMKDLFAQTAEALAIAIDAKDKYTHGHSVRVAEYSKRMAELAGFSAEFCEEVYFAGILHDVGKIGIPDGIINKSTRLTEEEYRLIKQHPVTGKEILRRISKMPFLSIGANYHHERFDGLGYPEGFKATDIPTIARIISVADAYDAMTSKRSYREPLPQEKVRDEILRGSGTQFDPQFVELMIQMIDGDTEYSMKDKSGNGTYMDSYELVCEDFRKQYSAGISVTQNRVEIHFECRRGHEPGAGLPSLVLFDSLDGRVHVEDREQKELGYFEYCEIRSDGIRNCSNVRDIKVDTWENGEVSDDVKLLNYTLTAVKCRDHVFIHIDDGTRFMEATVALPDSIRFVYLGITGEHCRISSLTECRDQELYSEENIHRLVDEITYIQGPEGDVPSIQVTGWRSCCTCGIPIEESVKVLFHARSLPVARLVWHCPFVLIFTSEDGTVGGEGYRELGFVRFDGESWQSDNASRNGLKVTKTSEFKGWDEWKQGNKDGRDVILHLKRDGNDVKLLCDFGGMLLENTTFIDDKIDDIYVALTGDQCVLEDIRVQR